MNPELDLLQDICSRINPGDRNTREECFDLEHRLRSYNDIIVRKYNFYVSIIPILPKHDDIIATVKKEHLGNSKVD